jgi:hypothetical protein
MYVQKMKKFYFLLSLAMATAQFGKAQGFYYYANFNAGAWNANGTSVTGTGFFTVKTAVPDFSYSITSSRNWNIQDVNYNLQGSDEIAINGQPWENKYGVINAYSTGCLKVSMAINSGSNGSPLEAPVVTKFVFNKATKNAGWGFMILDLDIDQCDIKAKDAYGNYYSNAEVASWFKGSFDGDDGDGHPYRAPCFDANNATALASRYVNAPCTRRTTLQTPGDETGPYAYFEPDVPVKELEFVMYNLQSYFNGSIGPSERYFIAAAKTVDISGTILNDVNGYTDYTINGTGIDGSAAGANLWAYLTNASNVIIDSVRVGADGTYKFNYIWYTNTSTDYHVVFSNNTYAIGATNPQNSIPSNWKLVGENWGNSAGSDGIVDGSIQISASTSDVTNVKLALQRYPESAFNTQGGLSKPIGITYVTVPANAFYLNNVGATPNSVDYDGGSVSQIRLTDYPTNTNHFRVNNVVYTAATWPMGGITVPFTNGVGAAQTIEIDPSSGIYDSEIPFASIDNAGVEDLTPGKVTMNFTTVLAVKFLKFDATKVNGQANISFIVDDNSSNHVFEIERSNEGTNFQKIGSINGDKRLNYQFVDANAATAGVNYYRIKQISPDGSSFYSTIVKLSFENKQTVAVYPKPASNNINVVVNATTAKNYTVVLNNMQGQVCLNKTIQGAQSINNLDVTALKNGTYVLKVLGDGQVIHQESIVVINNK